MPVGSPFKTVPAVTVTLPVKVLANPLLLPRNKKPLPTFSMEVSPWLASWIWPMNVELVFKPPICQLTRAVLEPPPIAEWLSPCNSPIGIVTSLATNEPPLVSAATPTAVSRELNKATLVFGNQPCWQCGSRYQSHPCWY